MEGWKDFLHKNIVLIELRTHAIGILMREPWLKPVYFFFLVWLLSPSKFLIISTTGCFCHDYKGFPFTPYVLSVVKVLAHLRHLYLKNPRFWAISSLKLVLLKFTQRVGRRILLNLWRRWDLSFRGSEVQVVYSTRNTMITSSKHFSVFF